MKPSDLAAAAVLYYALKIIWDITAALAKIAWVMSTEILNIIIETIKEDWNDKPPDVSWEEERKQFQRERFRWAEERFTHWQQQKRGQ